MPTLTLAVLLSAAASSPQELTPGQELRVDDSKVGGGHFKVYLPQNYVADRAWPVIFHYPGGGADSDTFYIRMSAGEKDFIVVGMQYIAPADYTLDGTYVRSEIACFDIAFQWLKKRAKIDEKRIFLTGTSKGGWYVSALGEEMIDRLAGFAILVAGRDVNRPDRPTAKIRGKSIYVGVGETDGNRRYGEMAVQQYLSVGADATLEIFPGKGHEEDPEAPLWKDWLYVHGPLSHAWNAALKDEWFASSLEESKKPDAPLDRYRALRRMAVSLKAALYSKEQKKTLERELTEMRKSSPAKEEWAAEQAYLRISEAANNALHKKGEWPALAQAFQKLAEKHPSTEFGREAAQRARVFREALKK